VGTQAEVVVERILPGGSAEGRSEQYVEVRIRGLPPGAAWRDVVRVKLTGVLGDRLEGQALSLANC
jgi:hypothetical protein